MPPFKIFPRAPQKVFFLISTEWSAEKGIRRSGRQVPVNMFVSLAAFTSLPCMFSFTVHLNFRHFDCLSAEFISPLLLFSESKLPCDKLVSLLKGVSIDTHVNLHCFACLSADSSSALLLFREAAFWQSTTVSADQICKIMRWILAML